MEVIINKTKHPTKQHHFQSLQNITYLRKLDHDTVCSESVCRLSTIQGADKIAVLQDGAILEEGRHEELLAKGEGGAYYSLISLQTQSKKSK
jgi:ABC-type multidrug transport system fused ATPase/permease subunit